MDHRNLPSVSNARLPKAYEKARAAIAACADLDECQSWADKMAALASYAKQSKDDHLEKMAARIRARAIRRCGELLGQLEKQQGARTDRKPSVGGGTRSEAAKNAGLSTRQKNTALRVARVPALDFDKAVDSDEPPTVTELAKRGTKPGKPLYDLEGRDPAEFKKATAALGMFSDLVKFMENATPAVIYRGAKDRERIALLKQAKAVVRWTEKLIERLEK